MKKITLLLFTIIFSGALFSQTTIFEDNFDSYTVGQGVAEQLGGWSTYSGTTGGSEDAFASSDFYNTPLNSMNIINGNDMVYSFGDKTTGHYKIEFKILMKNNNGAYINFLHESYNNTAFNLLFKDDNSIYIDNGNLDSLMSFNHEQWIDIAFDIDIDNDTLILSIDSLEKGYVFSNSASGSSSNKLSSIDFYGLSNNYNISNSNYFIDDFKFSQILNQTVGFETIEVQKEMNIISYPNPTIDYINITADCKITNIQVFSLNGQIVFEKNFNSKSIEINIKNIEPGIYFSKIYINNMIIIKKIIKN